MANCHTLFQHYNRAIRLTDDKRTTLITVRDSLRKRMHINYMNIPDPERDHIALDFQSQGSFVMDTIIKPLNDDFDLDDGVYFQGGAAKANRPGPQIFHDWVVRAVDKDNEYEQVRDKPTCVRVQYKLGFHIDLPIYYADNVICPDLAETNKGWLLSNPVEFIAWFEEKAGSGFKKAFLYESLEYAEPYQQWITDIRKKDCQLRRLVRYMKAWADLKRNEMPCGIIMTILVANDFVLNERDDVAFRDTLVNIKKTLNGNGFTCIRPTSPVGEDLFASTSPADKLVFMNALTALIRSANEAINAVNEKEACKEWEKHFGTRFPCHMAKETPAPVNTQPNYDALKRTVATNTPWLPKS